MVRLARADDLQTVLGLLASSPNAERRALQYSQQWLSMLERSDMVVLLCEEPVGFCILLCDPETVAGQSQAWLWDHAGPLALFLPTLDQHAGARQVDYLVTRAWDDQNDEALRAAGFVPEIWRVLKRAEARPNKSPFQLRPALESDRMFIMNLNCQGVGAYVIGNRGLDAEDVAARNIDIYASLDLSARSDLLGLIITEDERPFGYTLLKTGRSHDVTGEPAAYIYDISLQPAYLGKGAGRVLISYAQQELLARGILYLYGDVSCSNQQALTAAEGTGFHVHWTRWGRRVEG